MTSRLVLISHAATSATRLAAFPRDEPVSSMPLPVPLRADACYTGPETRCRQTAHALGLTAVVSDALRDCSYGEWSGHTLDSVASSSPDSVSRWLTDPSFAPPGGQSVLDLLSRVAEWLDSLPPDRGKIVAVTHPSVVKAAVVHAILATPQSFWRIDVPPLSRTVLSGRAGTWTLRTLAESFA